MNLLKKIINFTLIKDFNETKVDKIIRNLSIFSEKNIPLNKKLKYFGKKKLLSEKV